MPSPIAGLVSADPNGMENMRSVDPEGVLNELLYGAKDLGSLIRYGMTDEMKQRLMMEQEIARQGGQALAPFPEEMPPRYNPDGTENPASERFASNYLGSSMWGEGPANLFNRLRFLVDQDQGSFDAGNTAAAIGGNERASAVDPRVARVGPQGTIRRTPAFLRDGGRRGR